MDAVHGMDEIDKRHYLAHFIRLQVPDEVPTDILWQLQLLGTEFLHPTLPKIPFARIVRL